VVTRKVPPFSIVIGSGSDENGGENDQGHDGNCPDKIEVKGTNFLLAHRPGARWFRWGNGISIVQKSQPWRRISAASFSTGLVDGCGEFLASLNLAPPQWGRLQSQRIDIRSATLSLSGVRRSDVAWACTEPCSRNSVFANSLRVARAAEEGLDIELVQRNRGAHFADASFHSIVLSARGLLRRQVQTAWLDPTGGRCELRIERWEGQSSCLVVLVHLHG